PSDVLYVLSQPSLKGNARFIPNDLLRPSVVCDKFPYVAWFRISVGKWSVIAAQTHNHLCERLDTHFLSPAAYVHNLPRRTTALVGEQVRGDDVAHIEEVSGLLPVSEDSELLLPQRP